MSTTEESKRTPYDDFLEEVAAGNRRMDEWGDGESDAPLPGNLVSLSYALSVDLRFDCVFGRVHRGRRSNVFSTA